MARLFQSRSPTFWMGFFVLIVVLAAAAWLYTSPTAMAVPNSANYVSSQTRVLDSEGNLLHTLRTDLSVRRGQWIALPQISPVVIDLVLKAEDKRFWNHSGVDSFALANAAKQNVWRKVVPTSSAVNRGASTITMQLAGLLASDAAPNAQRRNIIDKWQQMRAAWQIEAHYSKKQILEAYLNLVTFRGELQGIDAAAAALFAKHPIGLQRSEAAVLAALIAAPQAKPAVLARRACRLLATSDCDASALPLARLNRPRAGSVQANDQIAAHAARIVVAQMAASSADVLLADSLAPVALLNETNRATGTGTPSPREFRSTLSRPIQQIARTALAEQMRELQRQRVEDGAVVVLDNKTGAVIAYVGSSGDFSDSADVDAANALRQAGSTLKPFLYAQAIEQRRITAASLIDDSELAIRTADAQYLPRNYSEDYKGWVSVRRALAGSLNIPAVRTLAMLDVDEFVGTLRDVGLRSVIHEGGFYGYSLALGSADVRLIDLTNAYRTLANGGIFSPVSFVPIVVGEKDATNKKTRVLSAGTTSIIADILADNNARAVSFGLDSALRMPFKASVKTGTSKDMRDNWCLGFTDRYTVGVWVGNASGVAMRGVSGVSGAAPIWRQVVLQLHQQQAVTSKAIDADVVEQRVSFSGVREPNRTELFLRGTEVSEVTFAGQTRQGIARPLHGAIYAIDPDIPRARQTIWFEQSGTAAASKAQWVLNGKPLKRENSGIIDGPAGASTGAKWLLIPGKHQLTLLDEKSAVIDQVYFEVKAPARVLATAK